jgi:hypothetical protein
MEIANLEIELNGIIGTITNYTKNPYIVGYTTLLERYVHDNNQEMIKCSVQRLINWYDENINLILTNEYLNNKKDHIFTKSLLEEIYESLS